MSVTVIYHANCADGFCAAWQLRSNYPGASFVPASYGDKPPAVKGQQVIIADFSYPATYLLEMAAEAESVLVLDHHKTSEADLAGLVTPGLTTVFDMTKSGARLVQEYYGFPAHWLVDYTEDRDLWLWKLPRSKEVNACIRSYPYDFAAWSDLAFHTPTVDIWTAGSAILRVEQQMITRAVANARVRFFEGHDVPFVNTGVLQSEIGDALAGQYPFVVMYWDGPARRNYSLRSRAFDVSAIARKYGGGGHKQAAGFWTALESTI